MFSTIFRRRNPASDYIRRCRQAINSGRLIPAASTFDELFLALTKFPEHAFWFRPSAADLRGMLLPPGWPENQEVGR